MKKILILALSVAGLALTATAGEQTIKGQGVCAKCELGETKACQNAIQAQKDGKTVTYYLAANDVSKAFHKNICKEGKPVVATGEVKEVEGKLQLTVSKIEVAK